MFLVVFHPSSGAHNTVSTVFGINGACTGAYRERGLAVAGSSTGLMG